MKNKIGVIVILCLIVFQFYYIYNKSYSGYIFNYRYSHERNNIDYLLLSKNLELLKQIVPNDKNTNLSIFINNENSKYDISLQYWYDRTMLYPITVSRDFCNLDIRGYDDEKFSRMIHDANVKYVVIVGKDTDILNVTTEKDITLYEMSSRTTMKKIIDYDIDLYSFEQMCNEYNDETLFYETLNYILTYLEEYKNYYSNSASSIIYEYANELYENNEYKKAKKYYEIYNKLGILNSSAFYALGDIYYREKDYNLAFEQFNYCINIEGCPEDTNEIINDILKKVK